MVSVPRSIDAKSGTHSILIRIFEKTDYNTSTGLQSVSNSGLLARQDLMTGEITSAAFIVNAEGHPQPVISLTDQQVKQGCVVH